MPDRPATPYRAAMIERAARAWYEDGNTTGQPPWSDLTKAQRHGYLHYAAVMLEAALDGEQTRLAV